MTVKPSFTGAVGSRAKITVPGSHPPPVHDVGHEVSGLKGKTTAAGQPSHPSGLISSTTTLVKQGSGRTIMRRRKRQPGTGGGALTSTPSARQGLQAGAGSTRRSPVPFSERG